MPVPISLDTFIGGDGRQRLRAWFLGGRVEVLTPPFLPYCYSSVPNSPSASRLTRRPLSTLDPEPYYLCRFPNEMKRGVFAKQVRAGGGRLAEERVRLDDRVVIDDPDFLRTAAARHPQKPRVMYLDIEQDTGGETFPKPTDPVISIAWAMDDGPIQCLVATKDLTGARPGWVDEVLRPFIAAWKAADPDLVVGFFHEGYDLPTLRAVSVAQGIGDAWFSRDVSAPRLRVQHLADGKERKRFEAEGRIFWDVHPCTEIDMELSGCEDRKLKTIAKFLGLALIESDGYNLRAMSDAAIRLYNVSDVNLLRLIASRYMSDRVGLAEFIGAPLENVLNGGSSYASGVMQARENRGEGVVSDGTNESRCDWFIPRDEKKNEPLAFEGATVSIDKRGLFEDIEKADFASLYPSLFDALGVGSDNTRVLAWREPRVGVEPLVLLAESRGVRVYRIDDARLNRSFWVEVRGRSRYADRISEVRTTRIAIKEQAKAERDPEKKKELEARAYSMKVIANSGFGYQGAGFAPHGSKAVGMMITAGGRAALAALREAIGPKHVIEVDTDGIYYENARCDPRKLGEQVNAELAARLAMRPVFEVDVDPYDAAYFYREKSYLLLDGDKMTMHGVAFKGSNHPDLFRQVVKWVGRALLTRDPRLAEIASRARDLSQYDRADFVKRIKLKKAPAAYASPNTLALQVFRAYVEAYGVEPQVGDRMRYLVTTRGYEPPTDEAYGRLDEKHYLKAVDDALDRLGLLDAAQGTVSFENL